MSIRETQNIHGLKLEPGKSRLDIRKTYQGKEKEAVEETDLGFHGISSI